MEIKMSFITKTYQNSFLQRYDKDEAIPYSCVSDFPGFICEQDSFKNSADILIRYFTYHYEKYNKNKLILFCPGIGPGHTAYFAEIDTLCSAGYRILTLDYTGCGASGGERLTSINAPTRDVTELLDNLHPHQTVQIRTLSRLAKGSDLSFISTIRISISSKSTKMKS